MISRRPLLIMSVAKIGLLAAPRRSLAQQGNRMVKLALLGDSIFDNAAYVPAGDDVTSHVNQRLAGEGGTVLLAQDGAVISDVPNQLAAMPRNVTHIALSVGGNDALRHIDILAKPVQSVAQALAAVGDVQEAFATRYTSMLDTVLKTGLPTMICTIYDVRLPDDTQRRAGNLALSVLNDVILRQATSRRLPVLDLRVIFSEAEDYANAIEPSGQGAAKIAQVIARIAGAHDFSGASSLYRND